MELLRQLVYDEGMSAQAVIMTFAERLKELREAAGLSQRALGEQSGIPSGTIRNYEQGIRQPNWIALLRIAKALGVTAEAFADCDELKADKPKPGRPRRGQGEPPAEGKGKKKPRGK
jgi:transcriptional regulator with XRE-family HTH domain